MRVGGSGQRAARLGCQPQCFTSCTPNSEFKEGTDGQRIALKPRRYLQTPMPRLVNRMLVQRLLDASADASE